MKSPSDQNIDTISEEVDNKLSLKKSNKKIQPKDKRESNKAFEIDLNVIVPAENLVHQDQEISKQEDSFLTTPKENLIKLSSGFKEKNETFQSSSNNKEENELMRKNQKFEEFVVNVDDFISFKDLRIMKFQDLVKLAEDYGVLNLNRMLKNEIICSILKQASSQGKGLFVEGTVKLEHDNNFGFIRYIENNFSSSPYDVYLSQNQIRKFGLRTGDFITGFAKDPQKIGEKSFTLAKLETINFKKFDEIRNKINFDNLIPVYPSEKLNFEESNIDKNGKDLNISTRIIDLISPIGKGQRALIVAPPKSGKTQLMHNIAHTISKYNPEIHLIVLLIDERPEEVTDMQRSVKGEVVSSTFDEYASRHVEVAEITIERAKRLVENGKDVVILLDNITRLARAYNAVAPSSGKVLSGGVDSNALQKPKRFLGAARNIEEGGSLTIIATALVETGSKMDEVIFEEFKGTGNAEIVLDRKLSEKRIFPAIDITKSGTRKEELLVNKEDLNKMWILRRILMQATGNNMNSSSNADGIELLMSRLKNTLNNKDFFEKMNSK